MDRDNYLKILAQQTREIVYTAVGKGARRCLVDNSRKKRSDALSPQTLEAINAVYQRDDISRMCPDKKEWISVKDDDGIRTNKQKRLLLMTISEAHQLFLSDFPGTSISFSMFAKQRPHSCGLHLTKTTKCACADIMRMWQAVCIHFDAR